MQPNDAAIARLVLVEDGAVPGMHPEPPATPAQSAEPETPPQPASEPRPPHLHRVTRHLDGAKECVLKSGAGVLKRVIVNTAPASMNGVLTLQDGLQRGGAVLAVITPAVGALVALDYEAAFDDGLFAILAGAVPGDWTIVLE